MISTRKSANAVMDFVVALAWIEDEMKLVTGDDNGVLQCWDFSSIFRAFGLKTISMPDWDFPVDIYKRTSKEAEETKSIAVNLWGEEA